MKTLVRPAALQLFFALLVGVISSALVACQPATIAPDAQLESVHIAQQTHELDSLSHGLPKIDPQPRPAPTPY